MSLGVLSKNEAARSADNKPLVKTTVVGRARLERRHRARRQVGEPEDRSPSVAAKIQGGVAVFNQSGFGEGPKRTNTTHLKLPSRSRERVSATVPPVDTSRLELPDAAKFTHISSVIFDTASAK